MSSQYKSDQPTYSVRLSRRDFIRRSGQAILAFALSGCVTPITIGQNYQYPVQQPLPDGTRPPLPVEIRPQLGQMQMALVEKIGQMMMLAWLWRTTLVEPESHSERCSERNLGGVMLTGANVDSPQQLQTLISTLQASAKIPLLISIDQEGGRVRRLDGRFGQTANFSAQQLGRLNNLSTTRHFASQTAQLLVDLGVNLNLAPVVDLNTNPRNPVIGLNGRSFSNDPDVVIPHALTFIKRIINKAFSVRSNIFQGMAVRQQIPIWISSM